LCKFIFNSASFSTDLISSERMRLLPNSEDERRQKDSYKGMFSAFPLPKNIRNIRFMSAVACQSSDTEKKEKYLCLLTITNDNKKISLNSNTELCIPEISKCLRNKIVSILENW